MNIYHSKSICFHKHKYFDGRDKITKYIELHYKERITLDICHNLENNQMISIKITKHIQFNIIGYFFIKYLHSNCI